MLSFFFCVFCLSSHLYIVIYKEKHGCSTCQIPIIARFPIVSCAVSDCVAVEGPRPDGVPDRKRYGPMKLLQFRENYRPAYWGTWSKKSSHVSPRCPFRQDKVSQKPNLNLF